MKHLLPAIALSSLALLACGEDPEPECTGAECEEADTGMTEDTESVEDVAEDVDLGPGTLEGQIFYNGEPIEGSLTIALYADGYSADVEADAMVTLPTPTFSQPYTIEASAGSYFVVAWLNVDGSPDETFDEGDLFGQTEDAGGIIPGETSGPVNVEIR